MNVSCHNVMVNLERPAQGIRDLKKAGFDSLTIKIDIWFPDFYGRNKNKQKKKVREKDLLPVSERYSLLFDSCRESGIRIPLAYGSSYRPVGPYNGDAVRKSFLKEDGFPDRDAVTAIEAELDAFALKAARECIEFCGKKGVKYMVLPPPTRERIYGGERELNHGFYMSLAPLARQYGICILLQNQYRDISGHLVRGNCSEPSLAAEWVDMLNEEAGGEVFGFCMDSGICSICGNDMHQFATLLGDRIKAVILRDCDGYNDTAMMPFTCVQGGGMQTDWMGLIRGLRDIDFDGELIIDFSDTVSAFSPLLSSTLFRLGKEVADYFKWQVELEQHLKKYKSIVLFGAGNMCRNYMKCYGEKYPPLFTCDNNPKLWDTEFEGLIVKNPEELRTLPEDCGVYICNVYYREIESQLREMGIANIEYFNDEYMPTFYFDRLERDE